MHATRAFSLLAVAAALAGCSLRTGERTATVTRVGVPGRTLVGPRGLRVTLVRYLPSVAGRADASGLATPDEGARFVAFLVRPCVGSLYLPTISDQNFSVDLSGGGIAGRKFPQSVFADELDLLGSKGCKRGYIVFQVPVHRRPSDLRFALDYRANDPAGRTVSTRVRFHWRLEFSARPIRGRR